MHALVSLASALNNADADGRVIIDAAGGTLKFLLLNAAAHFSKVRQGQMAHLSCPSNKACNLLTDLKGYIWG
jgi:hypothetical protein